MKTLFNVFLFLILSTNFLSSQIDFEELNIVNENSDIRARGANNAKSYDIDGDGDLDILFTSWQDNKVGWYQNTDGQGNFGGQKIISNTAFTALSVFAADIDGDEDLDVIYSCGSAYDPTGKVVWIENLDGQGNFGSENLIFSNGGREADVSAGDLDNDGDFDITSASSDGTISWFENISGSGEFGPRRIIAIAPEYARSIFLYDIDDDGDLDITAAISELNNSTDSRVSWYENLNGLGEFSQARIISTDALGANCVYVSDLDNDGDGDVISSSFRDDKIAWYENTNGMGQFGAQQIVNEDAIKAFSIYSSDIDNDGDNDILSASIGDNKIAWYENLDGLGDFGIEKIITSDAEGASSVHCGDIDGDNDLDVISASQHDHEISWFKNSIISSIMLIKELDIYVYPNPTGNLLYVNSPNRISRIEIYSTIGLQLVSNFNRNNIDLSSLSTGPYLCRVVHRNGSSFTKKINKL